MGALSPLAAVKARADSSAATLESVADAILRQAAAGPGQRRAVLAAQFAAACLANPRLAAQLFDAEAVKAAAHDWFIAFAAAREGPEIEAGGGLTSSAGKARTLPPPTRLDPISGGGQRCIADEAIKAAPSAADPSPADRRAGRRLAARVARDVFDSFTIRGRPIGEISLGELERLRSQNAHENAVIRLIQRHIQAPPETAVRDAIKRDELEQFIQKGAALADLA